jgi:hypothetical protein
VGSAVTAGSVALTFFAFDFLTLAAPALFGARSSIAPLSPDLRQNRRCNVP